MHMQISFQIELTLLAAVHQQQQQQQHRQHRSCTTSFTLISSDCRPNMVVKFNRLLLLWQRRRYISVQTRNGYICKFYYYCYQHRTRLFWTPNINVHTKSSIAERLTQWNSANVNVHIRTTSKNDHRELVRIVRPTRQTAASSIETAKVAVPFGMPEVESRLFRTDQPAAALPPPLRR